MESCLGGIHVVAQRMHYVIQTLQSWTDEGIDRWSNMLRISVVRSVRKHMRTTHHSEWSQDGRASLCCCIRPSFAGAHRSSNYGVYEYTFTYQDLNFCGDRDIDTVPIEQLAVLPGCFYTSNDLVCSDYNIVRFFQLYAALPSV